MNHCDVKGKHTIWNEETVLNFARGGPTSVQLQLYSSDSGPRPTTIPTTSPPLHPAVYQLRTMQLLLPSPGLKKEVWRGGGKSGAPPTKLPTEPSVSWLDWPSLIGSTGKLCFWPSAFQAEACMKQQHIPDGPGEATGSRERQVEHTNGILFNRKIN